MMENKPAMKKLNALLFNQGGKCFYCDAVLDIQEATVDHVIPQSKGGTNDLDNLVVCCKYANHAFGDYSPKQKLAVIKQLSSIFSVCQKIFPREEQVTESKSVEVEKESLAAHQPEKIEKNTQAKAKPKKITPAISTAYQLLLQVVELCEKEGKEAVGSQVKSKMLKLNPSFKESDYGFRQFHKFLLHAQNKKIITLEKHKKGNNYVIKKRV
jgi:hypothetical protein